MSLFSKSESYLGVDIGAHGIKLVELKKTKNRPRLWTYGIVQQDLDVHLPQLQEKNLQDLTHEKDLDYISKKKKKEQNIPTSIEELVMNDERVNQYAEL